MLNKKRLMAMAMTSAMVLASVTACSNTGDDSTTEAPNESTAAPTEATTEEPTEEPTEKPTEEVVTLPGVEAGKGINFEDGVYSFIGLDEGKADYDAVNLSVADFAGSKALRVESVNNESGKSFYIGIDIASLLGENVANVAKISFQIGTEATDGDFYACSFSAAPTHKATATTFAVYSKRSNPRVVEIDVTEAYDPASKNVVVIKKFSDTAGNDKDTAYAATGAYSVVYIDNIQFLDADGNAIEIASTDVAFQAPSGFGALDWSNATIKPYGEVDLGIGGMTGTGWWPEAHNSFMTYVPDVEAGEDPAAYKIIDAKLFKPGTVLTVYFECAPTEWQVPYLRAQVGPDYKNIDINPTIEKDADGNQVKNENGEYDSEITRINKAFNIIQFTYEEILAAFEAAGFTADAFADIKFMGVADQSVAFNVLKVTIGAAVEGEMVMMGTNTQADSASSGWGQAVTLMAVKNDGGDFDPSVLVPGSALVADFSVANFDGSQPAPVELILQSWTEGAASNQGWCKVAPTSCSTEQAIWTYEDMVAAFGEDLAGFVDAVNIGDCGFELNVSNWYLIIPADAE